ncbi:MAG: PD-(D/E)XK nuclease family protein, partial [Thermomicrobiales bacterium]
FPDSLDRRIAERLSVDDYASHEHWRQDVRVVGDWVENAVESFDTRKSVLTVEKSYGFPFPGRTDEPPFMLNARVDLVLRHDDGAIEHVDWKTGKRGWVDEIQNVAARLSVGRALQEPRVVSTVSFLSAANGEFDDSSELSRQDVREGWQTIKGLAGGICTDDEWTPKQGPLCNWCPYYQHGCALHRAPDTDA